MPCGLDLEAGGGSGRRGDITVSGRAKGSLLGQAYGGRKNALCARTVSTLDPSPEGRQQGRKGNSNRATGKKLKGIHGYRKAPQSPSWSRLQLLTLKLGMASCKTGWKTATGIGIRSVTQVAKPIIWPAANGKSISTSIWCR